MSFNVGDAVTTPYGQGRVLRYRSDDEIYQVELLWLDFNDPANHRSTTQAADATLADTAISTMTATMTLYCPLSQLSRGAVAMELDVAYQALETMRKLNLEMECTENSIPFTPLDLEHHCTVCLLARTPLLPPSNTTSRPPRKPATKKSNPCLCCGRPVCSVHASVAFKKERVHMCGACESLFGTDYVVTLCTEPQPRTRRHLLDRLVDVYDRAVLVLRYAATTRDGNSIDALCTALESATVRQNRVGLGSSSAGIVSGVLGIVSCATLLTPVGPPLVIASLVFGGSAAAAQTSAEVRHTYFFAPNQHADRLIALHGLCWNILHILALIRDTVVQLDSFPTTSMDADFIVGGSQEGTPLTPVSLQPEEESDVDAPPPALPSLTDTKSSPSRTDSADSTKSKGFFFSPRRSSVDTKSSAGSFHSPSRTYSVDSASTTPSGATPSAAVVTGTAVLRRSSTATSGHPTATKDSAARRGARFLSRSTTAALNSMQFARVGGGALSAATLVWETHNLRNTLQKMRAGNPCAKAETLRRIRDEIVSDLPTTASLADECDQTLELLSVRSTVLTVEQVTKLLADNEALAQQEQDQSSSNDSSISTAAEGPAGASHGVTEADAASHPSMKSQTEAPPMARRMTLRERLWKKRPAKDVTTASHNSSITSLGYEDDEAGANDAVPNDKETGKERICDTIPAGDAKLAT